MGEFVAGASNEAVVLLQSLGLEIGEVRLLSASNRIVLLLAPARLVAKVAPRAAQAHSEREIALARHLASNDGATARPALSFHPGPHLGERTATSLWEVVRITRVANETEIGPAYLRLRRGLASFPGVLPDFRVGI